MSGTVAQRRWDELATTFDDEADHGLGDPDTRQAWVALLSDVIGQSPRSIVDLGCGTGSLSILMAELGHAVCGFDLSPKMIERAVDKTARSGHQIDFTVGDAQHVAVPQTGHDVVLTRHVLWVVPDAADVVRRWSEPLSDNGMFIAIEGVWNDAGMEPGDLLAILQHHFDHITYVDLTAQSTLWGKEAQDHRYLMVGRRAGALE